MPPTISIALCTCEGAAFLEAQLRSLAAQHRPALEIIAVDDASTDGTMALLQSFSCDHPALALRIHRNPQRLGVSANFMRAFALCSGDYIAPCDQDDIWSPDKLLALSEIMGDHDLAYCDSDLVDAGGRSLGRRVSQCYSMYTGRDPRVFTLSNCVSGHAALFRRDLLARMPAMPPTAYYDWWLALNAAAAGGVVYLDRSLVQFRQHDCSASAFTGRRSERKRATGTDCWRHQLSNLTALSAVPTENAAHGFFRRISELWLRHPRHRLDWHLFCFALRHRHALFALRRTPSWMRWRHALKFLVVSVELRRSVDGLAA